VLNDNLNSDLLLVRKFALPTSIYGSSGKDFVGMKTVCWENELHDCLVFCTRGYNSPIFNEVVYFNNILKNSQI
jgi:hypothetical protein